MQKGEGYDASGGARGDAGTPTRLQGREAVAKPTISVVIPTRNAGPYFERVMEGISKQEEVEIARVLVADSRSGDRTREIARRFGAEVMDVDPERFNHGLTRSEGVRRTATPLVALMTQDALTSDTKMFSKMSRHFCDGLVAGVCVRQTPRDDLDARANRRWQRLNRQGRSVVTRALPAEGYESLSAAGRMQLCAFDNVCSMIRREAFEEHPFRATAFAEDRLWARDVIRGGWKVIYDGRIEVIHSHAPGLRERVERAFVNERAMFRYFGYRFVKNPIAFAVYSAKAAYGAVLEGHAEHVGIRRCAAETAEEVLGSFGALAGMLAGMQEKELG